MLRSCRLLVDRGDLTGSSSPIDSGSVLARATAASPEEAHRSWRTSLSDSPVRIIGSRELHQNLPGILRELENDTVRYVLTVHGRPRAVLVGAEPYLNMITDGRRPSEAVVGLQLTALLGGRLDAVTLDDLEKALDQKSRLTSPAPVKLLGPIAA